MDSSNSLFVVRANQDLKSNGIERKVSDKIDLIKMNKASIPKTKDLELLHLSDIEEDEVEKKFDSYNCYNKTNANSRILLSSIASNSDAITTSQAIGGPCGVLASLQAYILIELFFNTKQNNLDQNHTDLLLLSCLAKAICNILWKIGGKSRAVVASETNSIVMQRNSELSYDGITEHIIINTFDSYDNLCNYVEHIIKNNPQSIGCVSLLYSCLLTRDCDRVRQDFDDPNTTLIGRHNYCTQEMVNLFLMGRAVSNVFNNDIKCDSLTLHGVCKPSQIGFLSLYEFYKSFEVGSNYKNPQYPIYVILSESHFSVLFSKHRIETRQQFEMNYYDGLGLQEEEIRLTIRTQTNSANGLKAHSDDGQPLVPLECVIRTKWPNAMIDWNGATKLL